MIFIVMNSDRLSINQSVPLDLPTQRRAWDALSVESFSVDRAFSVAVEAFAHHTVTIQIAGECRVNYRNTKYLQTERVFPGNIGVLPAGLQHGGRTSVGEKFINIHLDRSLVERVAGDECGTRDIEIVPQFNRADSQILLYRSGIASRACSGRCDRTIVRRIAWRRAQPLTYSKIYGSKEMLARDYAGGLPKYKLRRATERINDFLGEDVNPRRTSRGCRDERLLLRSTVQAIHRQNSAAVHHRTKDQPRQTTAF